MKKAIFALLFALTLLPALAFAPAQAFAKDARVEKAEAWLGALKTGQARFTQTGYDGSQLSGNFYISRPGRLRFEYDAPTKDFIVADGTFIHFYDAQQKQASSAPIGTTLADFLLRKNASLDGDLRVLSIRNVGALLQITVAQSADPAAGQIQLRFSESPYELKSWRIIDGQGLATEITLSNFRAGGAISPALFVFKDPSGRGHMNN